MQEAGSNQLYRDWTWERSCQALSKIDKTAQLANVEDQASLEAFLEK